MLPKFILLSFWAILGVPGTTAKFSRSTAKNTLTTPKFGRTTAGPRPDHAPTMISSCFFRSEMVWSNLQSQLPEGTHTFWIIGFWV